MGVRRLLPRLSIRLNLSFLLAALLALVLFALSFNTFQTGAYADDAHYLVLGKSLASGRGYRLISYPDSPIHTTFPCGYPLLLSLIFRSGADFGQVVFVAKLINAGFIFVSALLAFWLFRKGNEQGYHLAVLLFLCNPQIVGLSSQVMSEATYIFASFLSLCLFELYNAQQGKKRIILLALASGIAALATMVRTIGFSILFAFVIYQVLSKRWRHIPLILGVFFLSYAPQISLNITGGGGLISSGYIKQTTSTGTLLTKGVQILSNLWAYATTGFAGILVPLIGPRLMSAMGALRSLATIFGLIVTSIVIIGWISARNMVDMSRIYTAVYLVGVSCFWNPATGNTQLRFLIPVLPFLYLYFVEGFFKLVTVILRWARIGVQCIAMGKRYALLVVLLLLLARDIQGVLNPVKARITDLSVGADWLRQNVPENAIVMTRDPVSRHLYFERLTLDPPLGGDSTDLVAYVCGKGVKYVFVGPNLKGPSPVDLDQTSLQLLSAIEREPIHFSLVYQDRQHNVSIYQVRDCP